MAKKIIDFEEITSTENILIYMSQFMPSGNYETESLQEKLQKKSLTHKKLADKNHILAVFALEEYFSITDVSDEAKINEVRAKLLNSAELN